MPAKKTAPLLVKFTTTVLHTAAIWNDTTVDTDNRIAWFEARFLAGYPVLVSEENGIITGYASFGDWRAFDGFRHTVEHSVYVHPDHGQRHWPYADEGVDY